MSLWVIQGIAPGGAFLLKGKSLTSKGGVGREGGQRTSGGLEGETQKEQGSVEQAQLVLFVSCTDGASVEKMLNYPL